jgi:hypothetical protein
MSIASATDRLASPRRVQPGHIVGVLLLAIGLIAVAGAIAISSTISTAGRLSARPSTIHATPSEPGRAVDRRPGLEPAGRNVPRPGHPHAAYGR